MQEGWSNKNRVLFKVVIALEVFAELMIMKKFEGELGEVKEEKHKQYLMKPFKDQSKPTFYIQIHSYLTEDTWCFILKG
jgi:hypothetical protein